LNSHLGFDGQANYLQGARYHREGSLNRRRFLKYAGATAAVVGASALGLNYEIRPRPIVTPPPSSTTTTVISSPASTTSTTSVTSLESLSDYLLSNGVSSSVADMASSYGTLDENKKELGDLIIKIGDFEPYPGVAKTYQENLLDVLQKEDPNDISAARLKTLQYMFFDPSVAINMLDSCMYPGVFSYLDMVNSKYGDVDKRIVYATLGIPRFKKVEENESNFEAIMQRATDQQFKPAFDQMLSDGNVDKLEYDASKWSLITAFCTPIESLVWELLDNDKRADDFLKNYDMKALITDAFTNTKGSGNYRSEEWTSWDLAANRLGFNSWINWKWVRDNMRYDMSIIPGSLHIYKSPEQIYNEKLNNGIATGDCLHAADFSLQNLNRGAILAEILHVIYDHPQGGRQNHFITLEYRNGTDIWVVMNFGYDGALPIIGPFKTELDAANAAVSALGGGGVVRQISTEEEGIFDEN
jgi:hypothetical protein